MKTCIKCGGNAYTEFAWGCEHDFAEPPEPSAHQIIVRGEKVWQTTGHYTDGVLIETTHPLKEEAIAQWKEKYATAAKMRDRKSAKSASFAMSMVKASVKLETVEVPTSHLAAYAKADAESVHKLAMGKNGQEPTTYEDWLALATSRRAAERKKVSDKLRSLGIPASHYMPLDAEQRCRLIMEEEKPLSEDDQVVLRDFMSWLALAESKLLSERRQLTEALVKAGWGASRHLDAPSRVALLMFSNKDRRPRGYSEPRKVRIVSYGKYEFDRAVETISGGDQEQKAKAIRTLQAQGASSADCYEKSIADLAAMLVYGEPGVRPVGYDADSEIEKPRVARKMAKRR